MESFDTVTMKKGSSIIDEYDERQKTGLEPLGASFNFVVCMIGTALVATGHAFSLTTPFLGIFLDFILGLWSASAALCMFNAASIAKATSFVDLGRKSFGTKTPLQNFWTVFFVFLPTAINNIGALAAYITISSTAVESYTSINTNIIQVFFALLIWVLGSVRSYNNTKYISGITLLMFAIVVSCMVTNGSILMSEIPLQQQRDFNISHFLQSIPILAFAMNGHHPLIGMSSEMSKKAQKAFPKYIWVCQMLVVCINCTSGIFPSLLFGECTQSDSIQNVSCIHQIVFGSRSIFIIFAQVSLGIALIVQCPLFVLPLKEFVLDFGGKTIRERSMLLNVGVAFVIAAISGVLGILLGNITDTLNVVATVGSLLMVGPTAGILSLLNEKGSIARFRAWLQIVGGIVFIIINFYTIYRTYFPDFEIPQTCECIQVA